MDSLFQNGTYVTNIKQDNVTNEPVLILKGNVTEAIINHRPVVVFDHYVNYYFDSIERFLSISGIVFNVFAIGTLLSLMGSLKTQLKLLLSLAISDCIIALCHFLFGFYKFPNIFKLHTGSMGYHNSVQTVLTISYTTAQYAGLGTMCTIAVDILMKVRKPFTYHKIMSKMRGNIIITCLWTTPLFTFIITSLTISYGLGYGLFDVTNIYVLASFIYCILCLVFFFIFIVIYTVIFCSTRKFMSRQHHGPGRSNKKMAVTFFLLITSYFVCIMPPLCIFIFLLGDVLTEVKLIFIILDCVTCLYVLNTVLDPIIYAVRIPEIRSQFRNILTKLCKRICCTRSGSTVALSGMNQN